MCGITGWVDFENDLSSSVHIIEKMSQSISHRGPDASCIWISGKALIFHRRLSVIDPVGGGQPMVRKQGDYSYVITYNGELYNTAELRNILESKGYVFQSSSDTEVLLVSYIEWGIDCLEHLNGIFAFGIWDEKNQQLFLARDRFGVKPLFYAKRGTSLLFASELKALLANPLIDAEIDNEGLAEIFALGPARTTGCGVFKGVYELKQAQYLICNRSGIKVDSYWELESHEHADSLEKTVETTRNLVIDAIRRQLVSDVPLCTFLSGGIDSSAISAIAAEHFRNSGTVSLNTFSIEYEGNDKYFKSSLYQPDSDKPWVLRMSNHIESRHHVVELTTSKVVDALYDATKARDLPGMADVDSSLWLFCREVKNEATVALSGECADEVFGGYPWFHLKETLVKDTFPWSPDLEVRKSIMSKELIDAIKPEEYVARRYYMTLEEVPRLKGESEMETRRRNMFYLNFTWFMQTLLDRKDRMSMAHGLEVRVPYCDHRLVQYVWNIPWEMKMLNGREKGLLRKALEGILPNDVLYRKKSPYPKTHNPDYESEVIKRLREVIEDKTSPVLPFVNKNKLLEMMNTREDYKKPWFGQLMSRPQLFAYVLQINFWMRKYKVAVK
jgi:asparagine synthase (glutamine-hydrolysing)